MTSFKKGVLVSGVVLVAGAVALVKFLNPAKTNETKPGATPPQNSPTQAKSETLTVTADEKKISTTTEYPTPAGTDKIGFTLVVDKEGIITDATTDVLASHEISVMRQKAFGEALPTEIRGKKLIDLTSLDRIGGSSLTTTAFNAALPNLKAQL